jgi:putative YphP/YqiW family bacilliredoxin
MLPPIYPPDAVQPFRDELSVVGLKDLLSPEDVDRALKQPGVTLCVINSICGCAGGTARPAVAMALQNKVIPDHLTAAFAGMERDAVNKVREYHAAAAPPSSPSIVIFKDGKVAEMFGRERIEGRMAPEVAAELVEAFNKHCTKAGPSIPPEQFAKLTNVQACGSSIPRMRR